MCVAEAKRKQDFDWERKSQGHHILLRGTQEHLVVSAGVLAQTLPSLSHGPGLDKPAATIHDFLEHLLPVSDLNFSLTGPLVCSGPRVCKGLRLDSVEILSNLSYCLPDKHMVNMVKIQMNLKSKNSRKNKTTVSMFMGLLFTWYSVLLSSV